MLKLLITILPILDMQSFIIGANNEKYKITKNNFDRYEND